MLLLFWIFCPWLEVSFEKDDGGDGEEWAQTVNGESRTKREGICNLGMGDGELVFVEGLRLIM
jgi:hypothetical protein